MVKKSNWKNSSNFRLQDKSGKFIKTPKAIIPTKVSLPKVSQPKVSQPKVFQSKVSQPKVSNIRNRDKKGRFAKTPKILSSKLPISGVKGSIGSGMKISKPLVVTQKVGRKPKRNLVQSKTHKTIQQIWQKVYFFNPPQKTITVPRLIAQNYNGGLVRAIVVAYWVDKFQVYSSYAITLKFCRNSIDLAKDLVNITFMNKGSSDVLYYELHIDFYELK